jgi:hypothetical protein
LFVTQTEKEYLMKRFSLFVSLIGVVILLLVEIPDAHAQPRRPASISCGFCASWEYWNGTTYGNYVTIFGGVSNPGLANTNGVFDEFIASDASGDLAHSTVLIGLEKINRGGYGYCTGGGGLFYFFVAFDSAGDEIDDICKAVPSADINGTVSFQISPYVSNGGGMQAYVWRPNNAGYYMWGFPYSLGAPHSFSRNTMREQISDTITGHEVYGVAWENISWLNSNGVWSQQGRYGDGYKDANPPQFYWNPPPPNGVMYSCVYGDHNYTCYLGS